MLGLIYYRFLRLVMMALMLIFVMGIPLFQSHRLWLAGTWIAGWLWLFILISLQFKGAYHSAEL
jgi:hypothetical protein